MRNKQSFVNKLGQIDGKLKAINVLITRPNTREELNKVLESIDNLMEDLSDMLENEN
jgi:ABC-type transporter Mla subunit MlaD